MLGLLPWNAYSRPDMSPAHKSPISRPAPTISSTTSAVKRKRSDGVTESEDANTPLEPASLTNVETGPISTAANSATPTISSIKSEVPEGYPTPLSSPTEIKMAGTGSDALVQPGKPDRRARKLIQQQINLEILLKHNELRLIEQELAKCQTSLEQLRRCSEIPFPTTQLSEMVSNGRGSAIRKSFSGQTPASPAPWGVTDGPYSRHYSKWLLPDARFDGGDPVTPVPAPGKRPAKGRIRGSFAEDHSAAGVSSRSNRASKQLQSLPAGYGQPKEKATGPLLLKRKSDGVMVKLVCPDCGRHDFGSAQGFINHCRIGHGRNFTSHDAAAEKCGEPVEYDEKGAMVGVEPVQTPTSSFVHPLIRSAHLLESKDTERGNAGIATIDGASDICQKTRHVTAQVSPAFRASISTPNLSTWVKERGLGLDLQQIVGDAKIKIELPESDDEDMEEDLPPTPPELNGMHPHIAGTRQVTKPSKSPHTSPLLHSRIPAPSSSLTRPSTSQSRIPDPEHGLKTINSSEPSPTTESNQAPSLIDDDEEFEPQSPTSSSESEHLHEEEVDFHVQDEEDSQQVTIRSEFQPGCTQNATHQAPAPRMRRPSAIRRSADSREEKHVTFVSPSPVPEMGTPERKRRKTAK